MAVIPVEVMHATGPSVELCDLPKPLEVSVFDWPSGYLYRDYIFYHLSDSFLDELGSITTCSHHWFDRYSFTQLENPDTLYSFAATLLDAVRTYTYQSAGRFLPFIGLFETAEPYKSGHKLTGDDMKRDVIDTMLFLVTKINEVAHGKRSLAIVGI